MRRIALCTALPFSFLDCAPAQAQRTEDNAVTNAEDAFGSSVGTETIGLYSASQVRGFSPVTAGNVRLEGVYFDRQGFIAQRLVERSTVRIGLTALGYPFPAPTGIVDYTLRGVGERPLVSIVAGSYAYGAPMLEIDAQLPIAGKHLGVAAGASIANEEYYDGSSARYIRAALIPRWRPAEGIEITPFWSATWGKDEEAPPIVATAGAFAPPRFARRHYFGQSWTAKNSTSLNHGAIAKARIGEDWSVTAGAFRSVLRYERNFANRFLGTTQDGSTREQVIADPEQRYASTSGELRVSRSVTEGPRLHIIHAAVRARQQHNLYGGSAAPFELGQRRLGDGVAVPPPAQFLFGERTEDRVRQTTVGLAYEGRWREVGELSLGVQRADYRKAIRPPGLAETIARDRPWLFNAAAALFLGKSVALYGGYTRGLEESGIAPNNAANRNEALPAIRTRQADAGIRWQVTPAIKLVAGAFEVTKPYFSTDAANRFVVLGDVRHRGAEFSLSGTPAANLSLVAGAVLMQPRVTGVAVDEGRLGSRPLNQPARVLRANAEYRPPAMKGVSFDLAVANFGRRYASNDNLAVLPGYTLLDLGMRYRFQLAGSPAVFRLQMANVTNAYVFSVLGNNTYGLTDSRRVLAYLSLDL
jgi:iron complex outermembrane receptor protein